MLEVAKGVQYIHSEGIVHGDLKGVRISISPFVNYFIGKLGKCPPRL